MGRALVAVLLVGSLALPACGDDLPDDPDPVITISVVDHADALTDSGYDNLCDVVLTEAPAGYARINLEVRIIRLDNGGPVRADGTLNDQDGNGMLDVGESVTVTEPIVNFWDQTTVGRPLDVQLDFNSGSATSTLATGTWTPQN